MTSRAAMFTILDSDRLAPTIAFFEVHAPLVARKARAGNFVIVRAAETGERIPLTVVAADPAIGTITLIVQAVGKTTKLLLTKGRGDCLSDVVGPLGNPTPVAFHGSVACVAGGVGAAELLPIARALKAAGNRIDTVLGARKREMVILEREMASLSETLTVTTDDGSYGRPGVVTGPLRDILESSAVVGAVYAIGPLPMMKAVSELTRPLGIKTIVSLNALMLDGTGMCGGCRVTVGGEMRFACVDGPEFDAHGVDFDELVARNRTYRDLERLADERFFGRGTQA